MKLKNSRVRTQKYNDLLTMGDTLPKIAVLVVTWNSEKHIPQLLESLRKVQYPADRLRLFFVDNASDDSSLAFLKKESMDVLQNTKNEGFAKANNQGADLALTWGAEYLYFLNPDTEVFPDFLVKALEVFAGDTQVGQVQSLTIREERDKVQSWGNALTFLGYGYSGGDGQLVSTLEDLSVREVGYASGAAMMVRADVWSDVGGFEELYGSYHEDSDLSLKIRLSGYNVVVAPQSRVVHKYTFSGSMRHTFLIERNRYILGLTFFKISTLVLLLPAFALMEVGTLVFSFLMGTWRGKLQAIVWLLVHMEKVWKRRLGLQKMRKFGDKKLAQYMVGRIEFQEIMNPLLEYAVNPVMDVYWNIVKRIIIW